AQRRSRRRRHSRPASPARPYRRAEGDRHDQPGQGRGRLPRHQRRAPRGGAAGLRALHPAGLPDAAEGPARRSFRAGCRGHRPFEHRRQADGATADRRKLHRHRRAQPHAQPAGRCEAGGHRRRRRRPPGNGQGRMDQARRD
ncbi:hypothetical protein LTR94_033676, partial [Friedmanniomyces endolithicus]